MLSALITGGKKIATKTLKHKISPNIWFYFSEHQNQELNYSELSADRLPFINLLFIINNRRGGRFQGVQNAMLLLGLIQKRLLLTC